MSALTILLIRHAEKANDPPLGPGLTIAGAPDRESLVIRGWQRAGAWSALFGADLGGDTYPKPQVIYAADPSQDPGTEELDDGPSKRPYETIKPLCDRLNLTPIIKWSADQTSQLVDEIKSLTGVVLICWEHKRIASKIIPEIMQDQKLPHLPTKWDGRRFDVVLRFDRATPGAPWSFTQLFPRLLGGDSDIPMGS
jgi:hypothetical protein